jgi:hypothetical protein
MGNGLKGFVHVKNPDTSLYEAFGPEDDLPSWFTHEVDPGVFEEKKKAAGKAPSGSGDGESVKALRSRIANVDDLEVLRTEFDAEERETAKKALESRIKAVTEEQLEAGTFVFPTVDELEEFIEKEDVAPEQLESFKAAEAAGPERKSALDAFDKAIKAKKD